MSEALAAEVESFGIRILIVEPGMFRTNFLSPGGMNAVPISETYQDTAVGEMMRYFGQWEGKQPGDPTKAAQRMFEVITGTGMGQGKEKYLRLPLGPDCIDRARAQQEKLKENIDVMADLAATTSFDS